MRNKRFRGVGKQRKTKERYFARSKLGRFRSTATARIGAILVTALGDGTFRVEATVTNTGYLPTSATDRGAVGRERTDGRIDRQVVRAPAVTLTHPGLEIVEGRARTVIPHLAGSNPFLEAAAAASHTVAWVVRAVGGERAVRVVAESDKGGTARSGWVVVR